MAVFFTHISSSHKKWLNYINWEVIRLGRHGPCIAIALHCVLITVHLSTWFWNHEREDSVHCVVVSVHLSSRQDPAHNFNFSLPKSSFPVPFPFHFAFDQTFSTEHLNSLPLPFTSVIECCPKSWSCENWCPNRCGEHSSPFSSASGHPRWVFFSVLPCSTR